MNGDAPDPDTAAALLRALAHGVRLALLDALAEGERSVGEIERATGVVQPGLSQQLGILRKAGLVTTRREAKQVYYRIDRDGLAGVAALIDRFARREPKAAIAPSGRVGGGAAMFARVLPRP